MAMHKALARQLRRTLGVDDESRLADFLAAAARLAPAADPAVARGLAGLGELLQRVDATYEEHDCDLALRTRSLDLSSEELREANRKLQRELASLAQAEKALRLAASVFGGAQEGILITDADNVIVDVNAAFTRIAGFTRAEVLQRNPKVLAADYPGGEFYAAMWQSLVGEGHWQGEVWNRRRDGERYLARLTISVVRDELGRLTHYVGVLSDITQERRQHEQLERAAHYDALTGVPNRVLLADRMRQAIAQTQRKGDLLAVCYLDIDGFKPINDNFGHEAGDSLLLQMAERLRLCVRGGDTVARLGGDEFVLLLLGLRDLAECERALQRVLAALCQPMHLDGQCVAVTASIGVSVYPDDDADPDTLLRRADQAMYQAKQGGKNRYRLFDSADSRRARQQRDTVERVREAIGQGEFVLYYQPKVDMRRHVVAGMEALIRWQHPSRGLLLPGEFLPPIEDTDLIVVLGEWVIGEALRQMEIWYAAGLRLAVSVNAAAHHLQQPDFVVRLKAQLAAHPGLPPGQLRLEVLETAALKDLDQVSGIIEACRALDIGIELDDFGTGYSSLTYLRRLPADTLKIDQSFVRDMLEDREDLAIVEGVIGLANAFKMGVIAEGVETVEHGVLLMSLGCDLAQGYGIARPMPAAAVPAWVAGHKPHPHWELWASKGLDRAHLPLMLAQYEHIKWVQRIVAGIDSPAIAPGEAELTDRHECRFGRWYDGEGCASHGHLAEYREIDPIHLRLHEVGTEIVRLRQSGDIVGAQARCAQLLALKGQIVAKLSALQLAVTATT